MISNANTIPSGDLYKLLFVLVRVHLNSIWTVLRWFSKISKIPFRCFPYKLISKVTRWNDPSKNKTSRYNKTNVDYCYLVLVYRIPLNLVRYTPCGSSSLVVDWVGGLVIRTEKLGAVPNLKLESLGSFLMSIACSLSRALCTPIIISLKNIPTETIYWGWECLNR